MDRLCVYPKDVQQVTGWSERYGRKLISRIKKKLLKESHQLVTIDVFFLYTVLEKESVLKHIT
jgi:hypothetical protein